MVSMAHFQSRDVNVALLRYSFRPLEILGSTDGYSLLSRDRDGWLQGKWHLVVLDEAQNIKNASTHAAEVGQATSD